MSDFDFGNRPSRSGGAERRNPVALWFAHFTATAAGVFLAGLLLLLVVRWYVIHSVREALADVNEKIKNSR